MPSSRYLVIECPVRECLLIEWLNNWMSSNWMPIWLNAYITEWIETECLFFMIISFIEFILMFIIIG